jgi:CheY-like chemotaxis protein
MNRVLVIDDEADLRNLIGAVLGRQGIHVEEAANGQEGLRKAHENPPDLILCDLNMPVMSGVETLIECRRDAALRSVPFLVITGMMQDVDLAGLAKAGAAGLLVKPFGTALLVETVTAHLKGAEVDSSGASARAAA